MDGREHIFPESSEQARRVVRASSTKKCRRTASQLFGVASCDGGVISTEPCDRRFISIDRQSMVRPSFVSWAVAGERPPRRVWSAPPLSNGQWLGKGATSTPTSMAGATIMTTTSLPTVLPRRGFHTNVWCFSLFFSPSSQKRYGRGFNMVNDVQAGLSSRTYPERWLTTSLWDGSFAFNEPAKRRNLLKGLG